MNWTDEELDKLFQESAKQMKTPYQDSFWTEVESLLPEQQQKKRRFGWFFTAGIVLLLGVSAVLFTQFNTIQPLHLAHTESGRIVVAQPKLTSTQETAEKSTDASALGTNSSQFKPKQIAKSIGNKNLILNANSSMETHLTFPAELPIKTNVSQDAISGFTTVTSTENATLVSLPYLKNEQRKSPTLVNAYWMQRAPERKHSMYVQLGSGMSQSYLSNQGTKWIPSFTVVSGYQYRKNQLGFSAGLQLTSLMDNNIVVQRTSKVYNFSVTDYVQNLNYRQVYLLELPLSIDFRVQKQTFSIGLAPTYLASTVMHFSQIENGKVSLEDKFIGQRIGLNSWGLKPSIEYQLEVAKSWQLGVQVNAQVIRQIDNSQLVGTVNKLPITGQITLRKTLIK